MSTERARKILVWFFQQCAMTKAIRFFIRQSGDYHGEFRCIDIMPHTPGPVESRSLHIQSPRQQVDA